MPIYGNIEADLVMNINGTEKHKCSPIYRSGTVSSGNITFYVTTDNTSSGAPLFNEVLMVIPGAVETGQPVMFGSFTLSADKKTITMPVNKIGTTTVVGVTVLGLGAAANGSTVYAFIVGV